MRLRRRTWLSIIAAVLVAGIAFGSYWFQPWKLWTNTTVHDNLPAVAVAPTMPTPTGHILSASDALPGPVLLSRGTFITHEHGTSGMVSIIRYPDGKRALAIANLRTSEGPDVHVWLTDQPVTKDGWHVFDDGRHVSLGSLRGNKGNQLYTIPDDVDLTGLISVSIWCDRFNVSFGAAALHNV